MDYIKLVKYYIHMSPPLESVLRICPPHVFRDTVVLPPRIKVHFSICLFLVGVPIKVLGGYFISLCMLRLRNNQ
jgi:hypothetical protein